MKRLKPLRIKAEASNNASDWFDYAMACFPENPIGSMDELWAGIARLVSGTMWKAYLRKPLACKRGFSGAGSSSRGL